MATTLVVLGIIMVLVGLAGSVLPLLPGIPLIFLGLVAVAWSGDFVEVGSLTLVGIGVLGALAMLADFVASTLGPKRAGASGWAVLGAGIGAIVGIFFGLPGLLFGPFAGALVGEYLATANVEQSTRAGLGTWVGLLVGTAAKIALSFAMIGWFVLAWYF
ncbi:MAG: DUF456 domain-containing protein [Lysobacterales bacterium]